MPIYLTKGARSIKIDEIGSGFNFTATGGTNEGRFLQVDFAEGGLSLKKPGSITTGTGLTLDANGRAVFEDA